MQYAPAPSQRRPMLIAVAIPLVLIIAGAILWIALATRGQPVTVSRRDVTLTVGARGQAVAPPSAQADVVAANNVPIDRVDATVGERVQQGQTLAELYYPSIEAARQQAQLQVQQAQQALNQAQQSYTQRLAQAQRQVAQAQQQVRQAQQAQASPGAQPAHPTVSALPFSARMEFVQDQEEEPGSAAETPPPPPPSNTDLSQAQARLQTAQADYQRVQQDMQAALAPYQQQLAQAQLALARAQAGERGAQVRAPINGTVVVLNAQPGQTLRSRNGSPPLLARIVDLTQVQVSAPLDNQQAAAVKPAMSVSLTFDELPNEQFRGLVDRLTTLPGDQQQNAALVTFDNRAGHIRPGMHAHLAILAGRASHVLAVPNRALTDDGAGHTIVYVRRGDQWRAVQVRTGLHGNHYTEIRSGLQEGDIVRV